MSRLGAPFINDSCSQNMIGFALWGRGGECGREEEGRVRGEGLTSTLMLRWLRRKHRLSQFWFSCLVAWVMRISGQGGPDPGMAWGRLAEWALRRGSPLVELGSEAAAPMCPGPGSAQRSLPRGSQARRSGLVFTWPNPVSVAHAHFRERIPAPELPDKQPPSP